MAKRLSRAKRFDQATKDLDTTPFEDLKQKVESWIEQFEASEADETPENTRAVSPQTPLAITIPDEFDLSEVEALKEEIESWRDNMEGAGMDHLPKYEEVSECYDSLETVYDALEEANTSREDIPTTIATIDDAENAIEAIESVIEQIENAQGETPSFPGMY